MAHRKDVPSNADPLRVGASRPRLNNDSEFKNETRNKIRFATAHDNAKILTEIRDIVKGQLGRLKTDALAGTFDVKKALVLHKLAQTYAILDTHTEKEHRKYDFSGASEDNLKELEAQALSLLGNRDE